ncbi:PREDICTED: zinc finger protein 628-like [Cyprinodon variegatus]|uniref:Zinc finger protein 628-like n=1 Tax=Cyprinodon variegatus TaxID=28743 RepID=A0A3Q2GF00_CYPVA|nr:PREDICTED: zinc finger protein 628-like [Cyprinodon variegatus]XP_015241178.1 PREDICTED: zinc finger protein 628-like [Cyprinodon variegatus]XP_015241179.1 PREDICTED: zinc finger protein 628-like [Cyprinodon variegatus]XP_015241180.1 PREDICTED: zinc finger protein 628-like [Cyprinodon variegatus]XP_015241181.1 PREDICTED: zinc finger protein 628-like [Cyprinodon variegatus]
MSTDSTRDTLLVESGFLDVTSEENSSSGRIRSDKSLLRSAVSMAAVKQRGRLRNGAKAVNGTGDPPPGSTESTGTEVGKDGVYPPQGDQQEGDDESEDSDVSEVFEEDDFDEEEDEEDEEDLSNEQSNSGDYRCSVCGLQLPSKFKLQDHMNLHTGARPYCCAECGKRFCQIYNYRLHLRTHAKSKVARHWCRICLTGFTSQEDLKRHLSRTHFEEEFYECDLCKRVFASLKECENHVQLHKCMVNIICETCRRSFRTEKSLARHRKKGCLRTFKCIDCGETFLKKNILLKHSFSHLGLLPYTCIRCRCHFRLAKLYRQHKCDPKRIHCVACLREFSSQEDFQRHKKDTGCWGNQEVNQKIDEIRCLECGQRFDTSDELKKHAGAHQRVLKCAECGKGFRSALLLMSHMGGHAGQSPCFCQSCGLGFPHQQNYDIHLKTCGQTPTPSSIPKKHHTSKSSVPEKKKLLKKVAKTTSVANKDPQQQGPSSLRPHSTASTESGQSEGTWTLTLEDKTPACMNLVVFLPVCPTQTDGLRLPSSIPQTLPVGAMQALPQGPPSLLSSSELLGVNAAVESSLNPSLELVTGFTSQDRETPLDLSKRPNSPKCTESDIPHLSVKSEPSEFEISGHGNDSEKQRKSCVTDGRLDLCSEAKRCKMEPTVLPLSTYTASSPLTVGIKKAPHSPDAGVDVWSSSCSQLTDCNPEKSIKIEMDV